MRFFVFVLFLVSQSAFCGKGDLRDFFYGIDLTIKDNHGMLESLSDIISESEIESDIRNLKIFTMKDKPVSSMNALTERVNSDVATIHKNLHVNGFYNAEVNSDIKNNNNGGVQVSIRVDLKNKFKLVKNIKFLDRDENFNDYYSKLLAEKFKSKKASMAEIREVIDGSLNVLKSQGFYNPIAKKKKVSINYEKGEASLNLEIITGQCVNFGKTHVTAFPGIDPKFIANRFDWEEGELFNNDKINSGIEKLKDTQIFSSVSVVPDESSISEDRIPIIVKVDEDKKHAIDFSLMYSGVRNMNFEKKSQVNKGLKSIIARVSWSRFNAFGGGEKLVVNMEGTPMKTGSRRTDYAFEVNLLQPDVFSRDAIMEYWVSRRQELTNVFFRKSDRVEMQYNYPVSNFLFSSLGVIAEKNYVDSEEAFFVDERLKRRYDAWTIPVTLNYRRTDSSLNPNDGYHLLSKFSCVKLSRMKENNLKSYRLSCSYYYPIDSDTKKNVLAFCVTRRGILCKNIDDVPLDKRIYAGGLDSVRGYASQMATEMIRGIDSMMGGKSATEINCEYRRKINRDWGVTTFCDGARIYGNKSKYFEIEKKRWFFSFGIGARYYTSIGPIRLDLAFPINRRKHVDSKVQFVMSLGQAF